MADVGTTRHISQVYIEVNGRNIDPELMSGKLMSVEVDDSLYLPDMFSFHLLDPGIKILAADTFALGASVKISIQLENTNQKVLLMSGEITAIEPDMNSVHRTTLVIRGYDRSHRMHRIRKTRAFKQVTDSDLASTLASENGLTADAQSTTPVYPYILQNNQTDWEFLMERAQRIGYRLYVEDKTLSFKESPTSPSTVTRLRWGEELAQFRARLSTINQPTEVVVRGYNPADKSTIIGRKTSPTNAMQFRRDNGGGGAAGGPASQTAFSVAGKQTIIDAPVYSQAEAEKVAQAALDKAATHFIQADGMIGGLPAVQAGTAVDIQDVGPRFSGKYLVTRALHRYTAKTYTTQFWVSGGNGSMTITDLLSSGANHGGGASFGGGKGSNSPTSRGLMVGLVTNNLDDEGNQGRVKVKFPAMKDPNNADVESHWCRLVSPMTGNERGLAYFPEVGDEVVVGFLNGDPNYGYVLGAVWNGSDKLPKPLNKLVSGGKTIRRVITTRRGHEITLVDEEVEEEGIIIMDKTHNNFVKIQTDGPGQNKIIIQCKGDALVKSTDGKMTLQSKGDMSIKSETGKVLIDGMAGVDVTTTASASIKATAQVSIKADGQATLQASGPVTVKGAIINLN